jgi:hypothetical protein
MPRAAQTLFAALNTLEGRVISMCQRRHRHAEWLKSFADQPWAVQRPGAAAAREASTEATRPVP